MNSVIKRIVSAGLTHAGRVRKHNEDSFSCDDEEMLWLVADGMGGYAAGEVASKLTIQSVNNSVLNGKGLVEAFVLAHDEVTASVQENSATKGMATTVIGLQVIDEKCHLSWVGDSRAYLLRQDDFTLISRDHSYFEWLLDQGLSRDEALSDPKHDQLTQGVGLETPTPGSLLNEIKPGDRWLLCSDGLYKELSKGAMHELVKQNADAGIVCKQLVQQALKNGGRDNITALVIDVDPEKRLNRYRLDVSIDSLMKCFGGHRTWLPSVIGAVAAIIIFTVFLILR